MNESLTLIVYRFP